MSTSITGEAVDGQVLSRVSGNTEWDTAQTRSTVLTSAQGLISENISRLVAASTSLMIEGTIYVMAIGFMKGDLISNLNLVLSASGATMKLSKVGLYTPEGKRLVVSADLGTSWQAQGTKTHALSEAYKMPSTGGLYAAIIGAGTTMPTLIRGSNLSSGSPAVGSGMRPFGTGGTGLTDLPETIAVAGGTPLAFWVGAS